MSDNPFVKPIEDEQSLVKTWLWAESDFEPGDEVDVWDGDVPGWVPGVLEEISGPTPVGRCWMVKTEAQFEGLRLTYGLPMSRPEWIRRKQI